MFEEMDQGPKLVVIQADGYDIIHFLYRLFPGNADLYVGIFK